MPQVLHITSHMGGGVGKVLSGVAAYSQKNYSRYHHKILMLEPPQKAQFVDLCQEAGVDIVFASDSQHIEKEIRSADIIQLEWWHHPKMAEFLYRFPQIPLRMVIWAHISGCNYPAIPFEFVKTPQRFLFTSKYSLESPYWNGEQKDYVSKNTETINSSGGFARVGLIDKQKHEHSDFIVGYVGTLSYSKLHPEFVNFCAAVNIPDVRFVLVGDADNQGIIKQQAEKEGIIERFQFVGYTDDVNKEFARFDVFGYPLNPGHFGTTENALLESMAAGLPVVALNQCAEKYLIEHMQTGMLANNLQEYISHIRYLYENPNERNRLGKNARQFVLNEFAIENTVAKLNNVYDNVMDMPTEMMRFNHIFGERPYQWFLSCLGSDRVLFENSINREMMSNANTVAQVENKIKNCQLILKEKSKSSIFQFHTNFPEDKVLEYWAAVVGQELQ